MRWKIPGTLAVLFFILEVSGFAQDVILNSSGNFRGRVYEPNVAAISGQSRLADSYEVFAFGSSFTGTRGEVARNFHIFDLSGVSGIVTAANLLLDHPNFGPGSSSYDSSDSTETVTFFEVTNNLGSDYRNLGEDTDLAVYQSLYDDLGTGLILGSFDASIASNGTVEDIQLNAAAIASLQAAIDAGQQEWVIGGALTSFSTDFATDGSRNERVFRGSGSASGTTPASQLIIGTAAIPEPSSLLFLLGSLTVAGSCRRSRIG